MQTMDLPTDLWAFVRPGMNTTQWAKACGTSRAIHAFSRQLLAAEVRNEADNDEQALIRQLQLCKWPACHSLFLCLWRLDGEVEIPSGMVDRSDSPVPLL